MTFFTIFTVTVMELYLPMVNVTSIGLDICSAASCNTVGQIHHCVNWVLLCGDDCIFHQDNTQPHSARLTMEWLHAPEINILPWPVSNDHPSISAITHIVSGEICTHIINVDNTISLLE